MKTHFDPYIDPEDCLPEIAICGTRLGEKCDLSIDWGKVNCKKCLGQKYRLKKWHEETEADIVRQMGEMAGLFKEQEIKDEYRRSS